MKSMSCAHDSTRAKRARRRRRLRLNEMLEEAKTRLNDANERIQRLSEEKSKYEEALAEKTREATSLETRAREANDSSVAETDECCAPSNALNQIWRLKRRTPLS